MTHTLSIPMKDGNTLEVQVEILDRKVAYGNDRYLVTPVSGTGQAWVSADRVKVKGGKS